MPPTRISSRWLWQNRFYFERDDEAVQEATAIRWKKACHLQGSLSQKVCCTASKNTEANKRSQREKKVSQRTPVTRDPVN
mmetsp:Transcript_14120/g.27413  ORF Transcript_14120/g.27413 Transcript_14120/m.27413 type:complete len:80 (+) Transcript_14120:1524-1763(+)